MVQIVVRACYIRAMALTQAELEARTGLITSSVAPAIWDLDPYCGPLSAQMKIKREMPPSPNTPATLRGDLCEPACLEYARRVMEPGHGALTWKKPPFVRHPNGWMGASTDAVYYDSDGDVVALGEAKTVSGRQADKWGQPGTDEVPDRVLIQCCWHLACWPTADVVWVPVLHGGWEMEFALYVVERDDALIAELMRDAHRWYTDHIIGDAPAVPDGRDLDAIKARWPRSDAGPVEMTPELEKWVQDKARWRDIRKEADDKESLAQARITAILQDHASAANDRWSVSYKRTKDSKKIDWEQLARELGATEQQIARHTTTAGGYRVLRITAKKESK
jgi:predicted phage-related endonuclease